MVKSPELKNTKYLVAQPLTAYRWPFDVPTRILNGLTVTNTPPLPSADNSFWRWALSQREMNDLKSISRWLTLVKNSKRGK